MYVILIAIVIFGLSQEPTKAHESNGASKANGTKITKQTKGTQKIDHQAANEPPIPSEVTIGTQYNMESIPHDDHAQVADKERNEQDLKIQGQLALFTGLLVLVGLLQLGALVWQACVFNEHKAKFDELAKAATSNATAALLHAKAIINAERPWMLVEYEYRKTQELEGIGFYAINKGETPAEIVEAHFEQEILPYIPDELPIPPIYRTPIFIPKRGDNLIVNEERWNLNPVPIHPESWIDNSMKRDAVENAREFVYFYGVIVYRDMLHDSSDPSGLHYTRFCFVYDFFVKALLPTGPNDYRQKK